MSRVTRGTWLLSNQQKKLMFCIWSAEINLWPKQHGTVRTVTNLAITLKYIILKHSHIFRLDTMLYPHHTERMQVLAHNLQYCTTCFTQGCQYKLLGRLMPQIPRYGQFFVFLDHFCLPRVPCLLVSTQWLLDSSACPYLWQPWLKH